MKKVFGALLVVVLLLSLFVGCYPSSMTKQQTAKDVSLQALFDKVPTPTVE